MKAFLFLFFTINVFSTQIPVKCFYKISEPSPAVKDYSNANYSINVLKNGEIKVEIDYRPLKIKARYPFRFKNKKLLSLIQKNKESSENLLLFAETISAKSKGYYQCVDNVLKFVSKNFKYTEKKSPPFKGDCNTAANTTIKLLALCGIPARIRYVIRFEKQRSVTLSGKSLHAIIEIYYPGYGWAFSDPVKYHHFIPACYLLIKKSNYLLGLSFEKKNCLTETGFTDILEGKTIIYKLPNLLRFY